MWHSIFHNTFQSFKHSINNIKKFNKKITNPTKRFYVSRKLNKDLKRKKMLSNLVNKSQVHKYDNKKKSISYIYPPTQYYRYFSRSYSRSIPLYIYVCIIIIYFFFLPSVIAARSAVPSQDLRDCRVHSFIHNVHECAHADTSNSSLQWRWCELCWVSRV